MNLIASLSEFDDFLAEFKDDVLFRGQIAHHEKGGAPSIVTSFSREKCVPPDMQKWIHYCSETLMCMYESFPKHFGLAETHALLQHYGWRSFHIDATDDISVAAWFASNRYVGRTEMAMGKDCYENRVSCIINRAHYESVSGPGYVYVISRDKLRKRGISVFDLEKIGSTDFASRYVRQSGFTIGDCESIQRHPHPDDCPYNFARRHQLNLTILKKTDLALRSETGSVRQSISRIK